MKRCFSLSCRNLTHRFTNARYEESLDYFNKSVLVLRKILGETARYSKPCAPGKGRTRCACYFLLLCVCVSLSLSIYLARALCLSLALSCSRSRSRSFARALSRARALCISPILQTWRNLQPHGNSVLPNERLRECARLLSTSPGHSSQQAWCVGLVGVCA
jgi:hypothetical protein